MGSHRAVRLEPQFLVKIDNTRVGVKIHSRFIVFNGVFDDLVQQKPTGTFGSFDSHGVEPAYPWPFVFQERYSNHSVRVIREQIANRILGQVRHHIRDVHPAFSLVVPAGCEYVFQVGDESKLIVC